MNTLIVYAHPNPKSFNHAILETIKEWLTKANHEFKVKDLYQLGFKTTLDAEDFQEITKGQVPSDIQQEQSDIAWAQALIFIYPLWWFDRPAILKGWVDRVLLQGFAFKITPQGPRGLLKHQKAAVFITAGADEAYYEAAGLKEMIGISMKKETLEFCGINDIVLKTFYAIPNISDDSRKARLDEVRDILRNHIV